MQKLLKYIILFGIFTLLLINSRITSLLGFSFSMPVSGNYEFTKVMFFNIWSSLVIFLFFIQYFLSSFSIKGSTFLGSMSKKGMDYKWLILLYIILLTSTFFSESPIVSFLGNNEKSHSFLMWSNLVGLFIVFSSLLSLEKREYPKGEGVIISFPQIIKTFILSGVFVSIIGLKEYFFPTFNYGDLGNRLFSTFGHPNYLSIFLVGLMPFLYQKRGFLNKSILFLFIITLIFTKSFIAIFLFLIFNLYYFGKKIKYKKILTSLIILFGFSLIYTFLPEKLHSFVSRYFLWDTTIRIIFSDIKLFLIGGGADTLTYFFNNFKSEYVYIFENLGFTADRPHNIILNFFYHFGIFGLAFISFLYYKVFSKNVGMNLCVHPDDNSGQTHRSAPTKVSLIIIFIFLLFNPTNVIIYLLIIILLANLFLQKNSTVLPLALEKSKGSGKSYYWLIFFFYITIISIFGAYNSYKFYISETDSYSKNYTKALEEYKYNPELFFIKSRFNDGLKITKRITQEYYFYKLRVTTNISNKKKLCKEFLIEYNYAENYFKCGHSFWDLGEKNIAKDYYKKGLKKLPDLWNPDSKYYKEFLVKKLKIDDHRLTSKKYGLEVVLKRLDIR